MTNKITFHKSHHSNDYITQITFIPTISYLSSYEFIETGVETPYHILCFSFWKWDFFIKYGVDLKKF
jgi:hypothetical protein